MKIDSIRLRVYNLLLKRPEFRDDDNRLVAKMLWQDAKAHKQYTEEELKIIEKFLVFYAAKKYSHPPTIKRIRAKLQEEYEKLRGKKYYERRGKQAKEWQRELGYKTMDDHRS